MVRSIVLASALLLANASAAMILGVGAEAVYYAPTADGYFDYKDTRTDFYNNDDGSGYQLGAYFEHPVPLLPNLRIDLTSNSSFSGAAQGGGVNKVSFDQIDFTPYYEILDNIVDLDIGLTFRTLDGKVEGAIDRDFSEVVPMGYLAAAVSIPGMPLAFAGSVKYAGFDGDSFSDTQIKALWDFAPGLQAQLGYRSESLKINDRFDMNTDVTFKGPFVGLNFSF